MNYRRLRGSCLPPFRFLLFSWSWPSGWLNRRHVGWEFRFFDGISFLLIFAGIIWELIEFEQSGSNFSLGNDHSSFLFIHFVAFIGDRLFVFLFSGMGLISSLLVPASTSLLAFFSRVLSPLFILLFLFPMIFFLSPRGGMRPLFSALRAFPFLLVLFVLLFFLLWAWGSTTAFGHLL